MADLLIEAMEARNKGDLTQARQLLAQALVQDPHNEGAWMLMSEVVDEARLKRNCLQRVLIINPNNQAASIALMKLDTSPLRPVVRGERYKPVIPLPLEKTPPFTPPFTWNSDEVPPEVMSDLVYPDLTGEHVNNPPETPASFDWAAESSEPDKTIEQIFNKVKDPEKVFQPLPDTDLEALSQDENAYADLSAEEKEERMLDELVGATVAAATEPLAPAPEIPLASLVPQSEPGDPDHLLWDNPKARSDRLVILGASSIIYANPAESDIPHIIGLFNEKKMLRDLLGESARTIKFESIERLAANPRKAELVIRYKPVEKPVEHKLTFASTTDRNEALSALEHRLGTAFAHRMQTTTLKDKLLFPLIGILVVTALAWFFMSGVPLLGQLVFFQSGLPQQILYNIQSVVDQVGEFNILMVAAILVLLCLVWLVVNLSKPAAMIIIEKK